MKCEQCVEAGTPSKVYPGAQSVTCAGRTSFYDEEGVYHMHDPNRQTSSYSCSNGHQWHKHEWSRCSVNGCDWKPRWAEKEEQSA